jgi:hypothetical protein
VAEILPENACKNAHNGSIEPSGLPDDWATFKKGHFSKQLSIHKMPKYQHQNTF